MRCFTKEDIELLKTVKGGYTRESLEWMGVSWPPAKGWKENLISKSNQVVPSDEQSFFEEESMELPF